MTGPGMSRRRALKITAVSGIALALGGGAIREALRRAGVHRIRRTRIQLGTRVTVTVVHPDAEVARETVDATFQEMERLESILSRYRPETPVSRLAREGAITDASPELVEVLARARELSERTDGAFDVTVAPLLDLYGARAETRRAGPGGESLPAPAEVDAALSLVDFRQLRLGPGEGEVALERPGMSLTLDGIAKGYVVDRAVATLVASGADRVLVEAGGDLAARSDEGWDVAIQDPHDSGGSLGVFRLRGRGVATSGDYVQAFTQDRRHHHILDPRTGRSPDHTSGVTVVAPSAMDADALSTAAFVLGPGDGLALLEETEGVEGLIVGKDGSRVSTGGFRAGSSL